MEYRTYAQINLASIRHNGGVIREAFKNKKILSVLKADAYGHGIKGVLPAYETFSDWYAVATVEEGLEVRELSRKPVLLLGPAPHKQILVAARANLTFTVGDVEYAQELKKQLSSQGMTAECHLKIDSGLNRSGVCWSEIIRSPKEVCSILSCDQLRLTGTYTHFACGEGVEPWEKAFTALQFDRFQRACKAIEYAGMSTGIKHCCATGGAIVHPEYQLDMVRLGMMPLGMSFSEESATSYRLRQAIQWVSFVAQIKQIYPGDFVSYGCTFCAEKTMRIGLVTCGYADGYRRAYSNKTQVLIGGKKAPVLGRIAMDYFVVDLSEISGVTVGAPVILLGSDGSECISPLDLSKYGDSVCGEVTCAISKRVPRIYCED